MLISWWSQCTISADHVVISVYHHLAQQTSGQLSFFIEVRHAVCFSETSTAVRTRSWYQQRCRRMHYEDVARTCGGRWRPSSCQVRQRPAGAPQREAPASAAASESALPVKRTKEQWGGANSQKYGEHLGMKCCTNDAGMHPMEDPEINRFMLAVLEIEVETQTREVDQTRPTLGTDIDMKAVPLAGRRAHSRPALHAIPTARPRRSASPAPQSAGNEKKSENVSLACAAASCFLFRGRIHPRRKTDHSCLARIASKKTAIIHIGLELRLHAIRNVSCIRFLLGCDRLRSPAGIPRTPPAGWRPGRRAGCGSPPPGPPRRPPPRPSPVGSGFVSASSS